MCNCMKSACIFLHFPTQSEADKFLSLSIENGFSGSTRRRSVTVVASKENGGIDYGLMSLLKWYAECGLYVDNPSLLLWSNTSFSLKNHHVNILSSLGFSVTFHH